MPECVCGGGEFGAWLTEHIISTRAKLKIHKIHKIHGH